jgi:hypothetical protein
MSFKSFQCLLKSSLIVEYSRMKVSSGLGRLGVYGPILGRLPLRVFSIGKYAFQKKMKVSSLSSGCEIYAPQTKILEGLTKEEILIVDIFFNGS